MSSIGTKSFEITGDFTDNKRVWNIFLSSIHQSGATIFGIVKHEFYPQGFTGIVIIGESHIAIHTFPEEQKAWVEFASCGDMTKGEVFEAALRARLI